MDWYWASVTLSGASATPPPRPPVTGPAASSVQSMHGGRGTSHQQLGLSHGHRLSANSWAQKIPGEVGRQANRASESFPPLYLFISFALCLALPSLFIASSISRFPVCMCMVVLPLVGRCGTVRGKTNTGYCSCSLKGWIHLATENLFWSF